MPKTVGDRLGDTEGFEGKFLDVHDEKTVRGKCLREPRDAHSRHFPAPAVSLVSTLAAGKWCVWSDRSTALVS